MRRKTKRKVVRERARARTVRGRARPIRTSALRARPHSYRRERSEQSIPSPGVRARSRHRREETMGRNILGFAMTFIAGIFATIQGYQGITGAAITGNVIGISMAAGASGIAVIVGVLILAGSYLMVISETMRFGGIMAIVLGILSAIVTMGASIVPALIAIAGGFFAMTAE